jgi:hypothetical protein
MVPALIMSGFKPRASMQKGGASTASQVAP